MNIIDTKTKSFVHGYTHFCTDCGLFFSTQFSTDQKVIINYCPCCGCDDLIDSIENLLSYCEDNDTDPVNFYKAFPRDKKIPNSRTGATPRQVEWIVNCVIADKEKKLPVTIKSLTAQLGYYKETVKKVFEELHITETGEEEL